MGLGGFLGGLGAGLQSYQQAAAQSATQQQAQQRAAMAQQQMQMQMQAMMQQQAQQRAAQQQAAAQAFLMGGGGGPLPGAQPPPQAPQPPAPGQSSTPAGGPQGAPVQQPPQAPASPYAVRPSGPAVAPQQAPAQQGGSPDGGLPPLADPRQMMQSLQQQFPGLPPDVAVGAIQATMKLQEPIQKLLLEHQEKQQTLQMKAAQLAQQAQEAQLNREQRTDLAQQSMALRADMQQNALDLRRSLAQAAQTNKPGLDPDAIALAADLYRRTGQMPALGQGNSEARTAILDAAAKAAKSEGTDAADIVANRAGLHADSQALTKLQSQQSNVGAVEDLVKGNMAQLDRMMAAGRGSGSAYGPIVNRWLQAGRKEIGDPDVDAFNSVVTDTANEIARVTSGGTPGSPLTNAARAQGQEILNKIDSPETLRNVFKAQTEVMNRRRDTLQSEIDATKKRIGGKPATAPSTSGAPAAGAVEDGYRFKGGDPSKPENWEKL